MQRVRSKIFPRLPLGAAHESTARQAFKRAVSVMQTLQSKVCIPPPLVAAHEVATCEAVADQRKQTASLVQAVRQEVFIPLSLGAAHQIAAGDAPQQCAQATLRMQNVLSKICLAL